MNWKDVLHYGGAAVLVLAGLIGMAGVHVPGVQIDPATCIVTGLAAFGIGAKADQALKTLALFIAGGLLYCSLCGGQASAANLNLPLKAPVFDFSGYPSGSGFYFGVNTGVATGSANAASTIAADNVGKVVTAQGDVGLTLGYVWARPNQPVWLAVESTGDYSNISGSSGAFSVNGPVNFTQVGLLGAPWSSVTSFLPTLDLGQFPSNPKLPAGITSGPAMLYLFAGVKEQDLSANFSLGSFREWRLGAIMGPGARFALSNHSAFDTRVEYSPPQQSKCIGPVPNASCAGLGSSIMARAALLF